MRGKEARFLRKSLAKGHKTKDPGKLGYKYLALYNFPLSLLLYVHLTRLHSLHSKKGLCGLDLKRGRNPNEKPKQTDKKHNKNQITNQTKPPNQQTQRGKW